MFKTVQDNQNDILQNVSKTDIWDKIGVGGQGRERDRKLLEFHMSLRYSVESIFI